MRRYYKPVVSVYHFGHPLFALKVIKLAIPRVDARPDFASYNPDRTMQYLQTLMQTLPGVDNSSLDEEQLSADNYAMYG